MTKDAYMVSHRGAHGLFDDVEEMPYPKAHEMHQVPKTSRWHRHQSTKEAKMAQRIARGKPAESKLSCLLAKVLLKTDKQHTGYERFVNDDEDDDEMEEDFVKEITVVVDGKVIAGETGVYQHRDWDTGAVESPWLRECGMIRIKSSNPGGCHIVAKPFVPKQKQW